MNKALHLMGLERRVVREGLVDRIVALEKRRDEILAANPDALWTSIELQIDAANAVLEIMDKQDAREEKRNARN